MNVVYGSQDHGGLATMGAVRPIQGSEGHRDSTEREREEVVGVLTNGVT
jgi:hypothetical protein